MLRDGNFCEKWLRLVEAISRVEGNQSVQDGRRLVTIVLFSPFIAKPSRAIQWVTFHSEAIDRSAKFLGYLRAQPNGHQTWCLAATAAEE